MASCQQWLYTLIDGSMMIRSLNHIYTHTEKKEANKQQDNERGQEKKGNQQSWTTKSKIGDKTNYDLVLFQMFFFWKNSSTKKRNINSIGSSAYEWLYLYHRSTIMIIKSKAQISENKLTCHTRLNVI